MVIPEKMGQIYLPRVWKINLSPFCSTRVVTNPPAVAMREPIIAAMRDACLPYLAKVLARAPEDKHPHITSMFETHMAFLADYCLAGYGGRGTLTEAFICGLHKALFPRDYKQTGSATRK